MMLTTGEYRFTSSLFQIEAGEESETNPQCFGKALAQWMLSQLKTNGLSITEEIVAEDWGWLVMVSRKPFQFWVGCVSQKDDDYKSIPNAWCVVVGTEPSLIQSIFKAQEIQDTLADLNSRVEEILQSSTEIFDLHFHRTTT